MYNIHIYTSNVDPDNFVYQGKDSLFFNITLHVCGQVLKIRFVNFDNIYKTASLQKLQCVNSDTGT